jgi:hypothetical protein
MIEALKKYNWKHFLSDLIVVLLSASLTFFLNELGKLNMGANAPESAGVLGFILNKGRQLFT